MLNLNHLYYFHVAAMEGTVARAASRLGITTPTISEQIKMLERAVGDSLFDRTSTGLRLTDVGRMVYEHTTSMFRTADRLMEALGKSSAPETPTLRIGVSAAVSRTVAADFLLPVLRLDDCMVIVQTGDFHQLFLALRRHELDLVLAETMPVDTARDGLQVADLHRPRLIAVAAPSLELDGRWNGTALLQYGVTSAYRWEVERYVTDHDLQPRIVGETDDALLMLEAAASGACVAFVPKSIARDAIAARRVRVVVELEPGSATVHALHHDTESADLARRAVEVLVARAADLDR